MSIENLLTETRNPETIDIDQLSTLEIVTKINKEDRTIPEVVSNTLIQVAQAVDWIVECIQKGGRLIYLGAGTSGRLGMLDASECPPTYGTSPELVQGIIAGGQLAISQAVEGAEDSITLSVEDLQSRNVTALDIIVGIAASGRTPYVTSGLLYAKSLGCKTVAITCSPNSEMERIADTTICALVGPEVIMGSTRMKAGTAQKLILNMLTTATMIRIGKVYSNLMVDVRATNYKLVERAKRIVALATGADMSKVESILKEADGSAKVAIIAILNNTSIDEARKVLESSNGIVAKALKSTTK